MNEHTYRKILDRLILSANIFLAEGSNVSNEVSEGFTTIIEDSDISMWKSNVDGQIKTVSDLLFELDTAINKKDRQRCIELISILRCANADIASAFSNATDSLENLVVSIRNETS